MVHYKHIMQHNWLGYKPVQKWYQSHASEPWEKPIHKHDQVVHTRRYLQRETPKRLFPWNSRKKSLSPESKEILVKKMKEVEVFNASKMSAKTKDHGKKIASTQKEKRARCYICKERAHYEINDVPTDTKDKDEILESEFFDTRQAFLSLCQGNHYQYDTLRRAKHSSMMALYHLHNPTAPAFVINCVFCRSDIETGQGWRCEICPDYDICNACYRNNRGSDHPHKLTHHPSIAERDAQSTEAREQRVVQLRKMLDLLVHASQCRAGQCPYPNCRKVKGLFRHGMQCKVRAAGGCPLCKKMWHLLQLHSRSCKDSPCSVPRCRHMV
ncbi:histone acetyltransferase HAC1-like protein isoform X1 [Tanacetum coccineum]